MKPQRLQIGDIARLFNLSVSSVRHYERMGLVRPEYTDPETGYRYYGPRQFEAFNAIRYLRTLDMPLAEIADFLQNRDVETMEEKLRQQKAAVAEKRRELARIEQKIDNRLRQIQDARTAVPDEIQLVSMPACRLYWVDELLKIENLYDMALPTSRLAQAQTEAVVFLGKVGVGVSQAHLEAGCFDRYDGVFLLLDEEDVFEGPVQNLPETLCVRVRFRGSHPQAPAQYSRLMAYLRANGLQAAGFSREVVLIDYCLTEDTSRYITEISIPVAEK